MMRGKIDHFADAQAEAVWPGEDDEDRNVPMFSLEQVEYLEKLFAPKDPLGDFSVAGSFDGAIALATSVAALVGSRRVIAHMRAIAENPPSRSRS